MKRICVRVSDGEYQATLRTIMRIQERNPQLKMSVNKIMRALLLDWLNAVSESEKERGK